MALILPAAPSGLMLPGRTRVLPSPTYLAVPNALVGMWSFTPGFVDLQNSVVPDLSGNGNVGTIFGSPTLKSSPFSSALYFDGTGNQYITTAGPILPGAFSFAAWTTLDSGAGAFPVLVVDATGLTTVIFGVNIATGSGFNLYVRAKQTTNTTTPTNNIIYHVVVTFDGTGVVQTYVNGIPIGGQTGSNPSQSTINGLRMFKDGFYGNSPWKGQCLEMRAYSRALDGGEILQLYRAGTTGQSLFSKLTTRAAELPALFQPPPVAFTRRLPTTGADIERLPPIKRSMDEPPAGFFQPSQVPVPTSWLPKTGETNRERDRNPIRRPDEPPGPFFQPSQVPVPTSWLPNTGETNRERDPIPIRRLDEPPPGFFTRSPNPVSTSWLPKTGETNRERDRNPIRRPDEPPAGFFQPSQVPVPIFLWFGGWDQPRLRLATDSYAVTWPAHPISGTATPNSWLPRTGENRERDLVPFRRPDESFVWGYVLFVPTRRPKIAPLAIRAKTGQIIILSPNMAVRGSTVLFSGACLDQHGNPVIPDTANIYLVYTNDNQLRTLVGPFAMIIAGNTILYRWDSSALLSDAKPVHASIRASAGGSMIAADCVVLLSANEANLPT